MQWEWRQRRDRGRVEEHWGEEEAGVDDYIALQHMVMMIVTSEYCCHWRQWVSHCLLDWMVERRYDEHRTAREDEAHSERSWREEVVEEQKQMIQV